MNSKLNSIVDKIRAEGKDYSDFKTLLLKIQESKDEIDKDDILELVTTDYRIQLHTTPNSIAKLISHLAISNNPENAIDICCGTGNILYYLQNSISDLTGVEINNNVAKITSYFIPDLNIITADTFKYPFSRKYDLVVGNIPWGMRVNYKDKLIPGEEAFVRKSFDIINEKGKIILLVPYSLLVGSQFHTLRNDFIQSLHEIISLPPGVIRNSKAKTALLVFDKHKSNSISIVQLNQFEKLTEEFIQVEKKEYLKKDFVERWDPEFHLSKENSFYKELENFTTTNLNELAEIITGKNIPGENLLEEGALLYLKPINIKGEKLIIDNGSKFVNKNNLTEKEFKYIVQPGDIVLSTIFNDLKMYVYSSKDVPAFASNNIAIIRSSEQDYIYSYLQTEEGKRIFKTQAEDLKRGVFIPRLSVKDLAIIKIPILPLSQLNILGNQFISTATNTQLEETLELLKQYKLQVELLKQENINSLKAFVEDRFNRIELQLDFVHNKLDKLLNILIELKTDFQSIRSLQRDEEEKVFKLCQKIDSKLDVIYREEKVTIESYIIEIKRWLDLWELLDIQSQKFLPIAEFIFDELNKIPEADYAPFVIQYCRALENEIFKKLFEAYHSMGLRDVNIDEMIKNDLEHPKTGRFASMIKKNRLTYTLGDMNFIMSLLKQGGNTLNESLLLQHFRAFVILYFEERIVEAIFLNDIDKLTSDFRNKAAHPYPIGIDMAKQCQELLRKSLNIFLESLKNR